VPLEPRFLLWIDAIGGYLVCLGDAITIGQAVPGNRVDIPIFGDISRRHAVIRRDREAYLIEPLAAIGISGNTVIERRILRDGEQIELGRRVALRFRQPHPLSLSARLEFVSRHRTQPSADGVLLMADSLVLGPGQNQSVNCRHWSKNVILFRDRGEFRCRTQGIFEIDGKTVDTLGVVSTNSRVSGDDFALRLEEL
jgi:hypothetical protein